MVYDGEVGHWGAAAELQAGCLSLGLLSARPQIYCVILGKSPNFSGPQLPHIWQEGLVLKLKCVHILRTSLMRWLVGTPLRGSVPGPGVGFHPYLLSLRGFSVTSGGQSRIFKPISIQTMW